ncbi:MAG: ABC transporter permease, partial [Acidobacteriota bacterium]
PLLTLLAASTLALGIGGTTAIFSMVHGVLLNPFSAPEAHRLIEFHEREENGDRHFLSYPGFLDYRNQSETLEDLAVLRMQSVSVFGVGGPPERIRGAFVSASFFTVLREEPALGRAIQPGEDAPGGARTAVISHGFWQRRFGGERSALGSVLKFDNQDHTIVGIMPESFLLPLDATDAWISLHSTPGGLDRRARSLFTIGRLADGFALEDARQELTVLAAAFAEANPEDPQNVHADVVRLGEAVTGQRIRSLLTILVSAVAMVLLIGVANVANLQLAQASTRSREMAIRTAVGASGRSLVAQTLVESLLLALIGGLLGLAVAYGGVRLLSGYGGLATRYSVEPNLQVLGFSCLISVLTGLLFGLAPARQTLKISLVDGLREGGRGSGSGRSNQRVRAGLVVLQMGLAVMLVIGAGLLLRSASNLRSIEVGFEKEQLLMVQFRIPENKYETEEQIRAFFDGVLESVGALPGVESAATALGMPFTGDEGTAAVLAEGVDPNTDAQLPSLSLNIVSLGYFETLGIPLLAGRTFDGSERAGEPAVLLSREAASRVWPGQDDVLGKALSIRGGERRYRVIGVVDDIYSSGLRSGIDPMLYFCNLQEPSRFATLSARVVGDPYEHSEAVRQAIWSVDPDQPLWEIMSQADRIRGWNSFDRLITSLLSVFALVALGLAAIGIGGILAYQVTQRRREFSIRLSLGASRGRIIKMIFGQGLALVGV